MDNKSNEDVYTTLPPTDILKINLLNRRDNVTSIIGDYMQKYYAGGSPPGHLVLGAVYGLLVDIEAQLDRSVSTEEFETITKLVYSKDTDDSIKAFRKINAWFDKIKLTRFDTSKQYDTSRAENENRFKNL